MPRRRGFRRAVKAFVEAVELEAQPHPFRAMFREQSHMVVPRAHARFRLKQRISLLQHSEREGILSGIHDRIAFAAPAFARIIEQLPPLDIEGRTGSIHFERDADVRGIGPARQPENHFMAVELAADAPRHAFEHVRVEVRPDQVLHIFDQRSADAIPPGIGNPDALDGIPGIDVHVGGGVSGRLFPRRRFQDAGRLGGGGWLGKGLFGVNRVCLGLSRSQNRKPKNQSELHGRSVGKQATKIPRFMAQAHAPPRCEPRAQVCCITQENE